MKTLETRLQQAKELREQGYNCAQTVLMAFDDVTGLGADDASRLAMGLGAGAALGEICGVMSALAIVEGFLGGTSPREKGECYRRVKRHGEEFCRRHGALRCCELKRPGAAKSCDQLITEGIEMMHNRLTDKA